MTDMVGAATWYVSTDKEPATAYQAAANSVARRTGRNPEIVPCPEPYPDNRARAMENAWQLGLPCVELDDDLVWVKKITQFDPVHGHGPLKLIEPIFAIDEIVERVELSDFKMGGAAPTTNAYFSRNRTTTNGFVRSGVRVTQESDPRIDTSLRLKHDYDFTVQHYLRYGGVVRCDDLLFEFKQRTNAGGVVSYRTPEAKEQAVQKLIARWPGLIVRHSRREGEVSLRLPRRRSGVMDLREEVTR